MSLWEHNHARLVELAANGKTGREIAAELGCTRSAVLGRAFRTGVKLPMDERKARLADHGRRKPVAERREKFPPRHAIHRKRARGARAFTDAEIAVAIAARLAGLSGAKSAALIGASQQSLAKNWMRDASLLALGKALHERARADAAERAAQARELAAFAAEAQRLAVERTNQPILGRMPERHREMLERRISGQTLQQIAHTYGITRERVRQIEARWRVEGLVVPGVRPLSDATRASLYVPTGRPAGRPPKAPLAERGEAYWSAKVAEAFASGVRP